MTGSFRQLSAPPFLHPRCETRTPIGSRPAVATGLLRDATGRINGVRTDRPEGDVEADVVIACDGVNSAVRRAFYPYEKLAFTGINTWRGVTRRALAEARETLPRRLDEKALPLMVERFREQLSAILDYVKQLPPSYYEVYALSEFEHLSNEEIAARLSLTLSTTKIRLHRARTRSARKEKVLTPSAQRRRFENKRHSRETTMKGSRATRRLARMLLVLLAVVAAVAVSFG